MTLRPLTIFILSAAAAISSALTITQGTLGPCSYTMLVPAKWNGNLLMLAHGLREESEPLSAEIDTAGEFNRRMVKEGWLIAGSSYRRNGYVVKDAIEDIQELYAHIVKTFGKPKKSFLLGWSMGGAIGTVMAERADLPYLGYLLMCPDCCNSEYDSIRITNAPRKRMLLVPNRDESGPPRRYVQDAMKVRPYVWIVNRDGHCRHTQEELSEAFAALKRYAEGGKINDDMRFEMPVEWPKFAYTVRNDTIDCRAVKVNISDSTLLLGLTPDPIKALRLFKGDTIVIRARDTVVNAIYGVKYGNAKPGGFILMPEYFKGYLLGIRSGDVNAVLRLSEGAPVKIWRKTTIKVN